MRSFVCGLVVAAFIVATCPASAQADTIWEIVESLGGEFDSDRTDFDILRQAIETAELTEALDNPDDDLTVFAPNDGAFVALARNLGYDGIDEAGTWDYLVSLVGDGKLKIALAGLLQYHVSPERLTVFDLMLYTLIGDPIETLLEGATFRPFFLHLMDNEPALDDATITFPLNVKADNGFIHAINQVLIPIPIIRP